MQDFETFVADSNHDATGGMWSLGNDGSKQRGATWREPGYAEVLIVESRALASIPDGVTPADAAPLLCAGVTTYNALRNAKLRAGDLVAIQGIGGLGHLAVQFARQYPRR